MKTELKCPLLAAAALFVLGTVGAGAETVSAFATCRTEQDSLKRLTCYDAIDLSGDETHLDIAGVKPETKTATSLIVMSSAKLRVQAQDFDRDVMSDRVELRPSFTNNTGKTVVAIAHTTVITDAFGDKIIDGAGKLDIQIPPGKTVESGSFYFWEDNPFIQGEPFDQLQGPISVGTAKAVLVVTKAIYSDGTSESFQPPH